MSSSLESPKKPKSTILVVEDELSAANAIVKLLTLKGFDVLYAGTVDAALRQLELLPKWVILDLMLPDGDGTLVLKTIRDMNLPVNVIVMSGKDVDQIQGVMSLNPNLFIPKPIDFSKLLACISQAA